MEPLPGPPGLPLLGNILDIDLKNPIQGWLNLSNIYGPIYKLRLRGADRVFVTGYDLIDEICSRKDFVKRPVGITKALYDAIPEGMFTADYKQESWELAHRTLVPAFGPLAIRDMFEEMHDVITQMVLRWARFGDEVPIDMSADFTRLALDTIGLCSLDMRFNSFYKESLHPFVESMVAVLAESQIRSIRPHWLSKLFWKSNKAFEDNSSLMQGVALEVIARRRANPSDRKDLLNAMLHGQDPVTGKFLSDNIIVDNMITFLIAGHETTSALLSFLFFYLVKYPEAYEQLRQEVDDVLGTEPMTSGQLVHLPYTKACVRETLRLHSPLQGFALCPWVTDDEPILLAGKYHIEANAGCFILLDKMHKDPAIYGDDAELFRPERMLEENFKKLPPNSFKVPNIPSRSSEFAMQEAIMATAILIQKFEFKFVDPDYSLKLRQAGTIKPVDLFMYAKLRPNVDTLSLQRDLFHNTKSASSKLKASKEQACSRSEGLRPMTVVYGSNTGTCRSLASRAAKSALQHGFSCDVKSLNEAADALPQNQPVVIISSTHYEGQPPDNAAKFNSWLDGLTDDSLSGVKYAIFGCGNSDWKKTFQVFPKHIDAQMTRRGASQLATRGQADAGEGDITGDFDTWQADHLWPAISDHYKIQVPASGLPPDSKISNAQPFAEEMFSGHAKAKVLDVKALTGNEDRPKYHMEIELPEGMKYQVGDYLEVVPRNSPYIVERFCRILKARSYNTTDPSAVTLQTWCELNQPASFKQLQILMESCTDDKDKMGLVALIKQLAESTERRPSVLDLLETYPSIKISLGDLATLLPPIRSRLYSISSSPSRNDSSSRCSLTWSLISHDKSFSLSSSRKNEDHESIRGLASGYLASLSPGSELTCLVKPGQDRFRPPADPSTPVIMVCAGSGIAPFRGFVQSRSELLRANPSLQEKLAKAILYVGCRTPEHTLYAADLETASVDVRYAFSRQSQESRGHKYVQDAVWADRHELAKMWEDGARVYVCGGRPVSQSVKETVRRIYREIAEQRCGPKSEADIEQWWVEGLREQYSVDVF
ncbi:P450 family fatty acid hydroxylase [Paramyrothecium foliicola]|nr:P450 family fatty acid hydroxylase [Paramyrothecium foliicola]